jgi:hypothetical protein
MPLNTSATTDGELELRSVLLAVESELPNRKLVYLRSQPKMRVSAGKCEVKVRRAHILEDSYTAVMQHSPDTLKRRLMVSFDGTFLLT